MAEKQPTSFVQPTPTGKEELGQIEVAPEVIEVIAGIAATEVEGVAATRGNFASGVVEKFGKKCIQKVSNLRCRRMGVLLLMYFAQ